MVASQERGRETDRGEFHWGGRNEREPLWATPFLILEFQENAIIKTREKKSSQDLTPEPGELDKKGGIYASKLIFCVLWEQEENIDGDVRS